MNIFKKKIKSLSFFNRKKTKILFLAGSITVLVAASMVLFSIYQYSGFSNKDNQPIAGIILFYGDNCSHCVTVENFIKNNNVEESVTFTRLEVFNNTGNTNMLADKAQICGLEPTQIGVPFLWDGKNCIIGYVDVIEFFKSKITKK